ncbi:VOC family protein [Shewanella phaeophyticola]|uniref:VOC family protein n=1 Tax=Shewanella phaeophyticola TaxID=2978345 RepID=A0ABT2P2J6_9GAMM|nr:VOC family protein [Shewanella sp. KJ10-1]MCT8986866.1 VOC family protein [Shewanella sp. KJ10-1]
MSQHNKINYLEIPVRNVLATKTFFSQVFGWQFQDYDPEYSCFLQVGIDGGFYQSSSQFTLATGCPLIVLYSQDLLVTQAAITLAGGLISRDIFSFPGGKRFHFTDVNGNEYAVWSE